jgi:transcriptional regulator of acetoin/glycerol metabolism
MVSKHVWRNFLKNESIIQEKSMKDDIIKSWHYCMNSNVNPYSGVAHEILDVSTLEKKKQENELLLQLAKPHIQQLRDFLKGWHYITTITDQDGYILIEQGEKSVSREAQKIKFTEGSKWSENQVGTNAIGLALRLQKPISVKGYEHFSVASQQWNCTAAPIYNTRNQVVGVFNVSSLYRSINYNYIQACVELAAKSISFAWEKQLEQDMAFLGLPAWNENADNIVCNFDDIICSLPKKLLPEYQDYIGEPITKFTKETMLQVSRAHAPILHHDRVIGQRYPVTVPEKKTAVYFRGIKGTSTSFQQVFDMVEKVAPRETSVHLFGETGTGKELVARAIHDHSHYVNGPFLSVNCGAVPESLLESELFGYEPGAFTGANHKGSKGKLEQANGGTLFLDEVEEMPVSMQVQLLRALQDKTITRIGGKESIPLNFRIITAANEDVRQLVRNGSFREDLFFRIYVFPIHIPPLRERKEDIKYMIQDYFQKGQWFPSWHERLEKVFSAAEWKGNVRELYNALERCEILYEHSVPSNAALQELVSSLNPVSDEEIAADAFKFTEQIEINKIKKQLIQETGDVSAAAKELGMSQATLYRKMKRYNLS